MKRVIVGTAGHIDHGKTSLVKALTGVDTDRLKEEKERGITTELGFTHLSLPGGEVVGIVDVPGHERFIRHMVAGVSGIDLVMLVIAADEGIMPQTREHLEICTLLGVGRGLTVMTKADLVEREWLDMLREELREFLAGTFLAGTPVIAASSVTGVGIGEIKDALSELVRGIADRPRDGFFRLPVDRSFVMKGFGTVVTGTALAGSIRTGEEVEVLPGGALGRVRGIEVYGRRVDEAVAGQRTALNLQGVHRDKVPRGSVIARPGTFSVSTGFFGDLRILPQARKLREGDRIRVHLGTAEIYGRCYPLEGKEIPPGGTGLVQLRLEAPTVAAPGDRFVIRSYSPMVTVGGGSIVAAWDGKRRRRRDVLTDLETARRGDHLLLAARRAGREGIDLKGLGDALKIPRDALLPLVEAAVGDGKLIPLQGISPCYVEAATAEALTAAAAAEVHEYCRGNPSSRGMPRELLRGKIGAAERVFDGIVARMVKEGTLRKEEMLLSPAGHKASLGGEMGEKSAALEEAFRGEGLSPRESGELLKAAGLDARKGGETLSFLLQEGALVRVKDDYLVHRAAAAALVEKVRAFFGGKREMTVPEFKELTGVSRKFLIPLLEYLDRSRITIRVGDVRKLRGQGS